MKERKTLWVQNKKTLHGPGRTVSRKCFQMCFQKAVWTKIMARIKVVTTRFLQTSDYVLLFQPFRPHRSPIVVQWKPSLSLQISSSAPPSQVKGHIFIVAKPTKALSGDRVEPQGVHWSPICRNPAAEARLRRLIARFVKLVLFQSKLRKPHSLPSSLQPRAAGLCANLQLVAL